VVLGGSHVLAYEGVEVQMMIDDRSRCMYSQSVHP
jgi:hypothetical protein